MPLTVTVLVALYAVQHNGTGKIGKWFGPIMLIWFAALELMAFVNIVQTLQILQTLNPLHAIRFLTENGWTAFVALRSVVLPLTGAEAFYADMGNLGKSPVRIAWFSIIFPALALNYLGQGALLLAHPDAISNPFYQQLGPWSVYPLVVLSTVAPVIASQATISGTFKITHQAISLDVLPWLRIIYASEQDIAQIYIPSIMRQNPR